MKKVDFRSDTVTQPTEEMRRAMLSAEVGDDVYGDDPSVNALEQRAAEIVGKEAALFVVSGTMGNQLAIMTHTRRGDEIIASRHSHVVVNEVGAAAVLSGVSIHMVDSSDGLVRASDVEAGVRDDNIHYPGTGLVCVENALGNGRVVPMDLLEETCRAAHKRHLPVHMDGARLFNAACSLGVEAREIASHVDSVMFCLSKGLCAPVGSILAGTKDFIERARKHRKLLGGGMRQAGVLAAPGLIALDTMTKRLGEDHENARYLAEQLSQMKHVHCPVEDVQINMVFFTVDKPGFSSPDFVEQMARQDILVSGAYGGPFRLVTHHGISREDIDRFLALFSSML